MFGFGRKAQVITTDVTTTWDDELYAALDAGRLVPTSFAMKAWYEGIKAQGGYMKALVKFHSN